MRKVQMVTAIEAKMRSAYLQGSQRCERGQFGAETIVQEAWPCKITPNYVTNDKIFRVESALGVLLRTLTEQVPLGKINPPVVFNPRCLNPWL
jgi:hypothetical protein